MLALRRTMTARRWALLIALSVGVFALGLSAEADGDIWWHLAAGREMVRTRSLLFSDPFSLSAAGRAWTDVHWLFQLVAYAVHQLGGLLGLVIWKSALVTLGAGLLFLTVLRSAGGRGLALFAPGLLASLFLVRESLQLRPVIVTLLCLASFLFELETHRRRGAARLLWTLPFVQLVWANVQGLFVLGPLLVGAYALAASASRRFGGRASYPFVAEFSDPERSRAGTRGLWLLLAFTSLACLLSPFGVESVRLPSLLWSRLLPESSNVFSANIAENVPPFAALAVETGRFVHLQWFLGLLALSLLAAGARLRLSHVLVLAGFVVLALLANRNIVLLYWVGAPLAVISAAPALARASRALGRWRRSAPLRLCGYAAFALPLALAVSAAAREPSLSAPAPFRVPETSSGLIAARAQGGDVFSADAYGGYLIWRLYPEHRPYIDTRLVLRTAAEYREYLRVVDEPSRFDEFQRRHRFTYVVLPTAQPDRYLGLIAHLYRSPDWRLIYTDGAEALFAARDASATPGLDLASESTTQQLVAALSAKYGASGPLADAARVHLATLLSSLAEFTQAERVLSGAGGPEAAALRARCLVARGDSEGARKISAELVASDANDVQSLNLLGVVALERGRARDALQWVRRALAKSPRDAEAERILSSIEEQHHGESP